MKNLLIIGDNFLSVWTRSLRLAAAFAFTRVTWQPLHECLVQPGNPYTNVQDNLATLTLIVQYKLPTLTLMSSTTWQPLF